MEWKKAHSITEESKMKPKAVDKPGKLTDSSEDGGATIVECTACGHKNVLVTCPASPTDSRPVSAGNRVLFPPLMEVAGRVEPFRMSSWIKNLADSARNGKEKGALAEEDLPKVKQYYC